MPANLFGQLFGRYAIQMHLPNNIRGPLCRHTKFHLLIIMVLTLVSVCDIITLSKVNITSASAFVARGQPMGLLYVVFGKQSSLFVDFGKHCCFAQKGSVVFYGFCLL